MERRKWARAPFSGRAIIVRSGKQMEPGDVMDLSVHDIFIKTSVEIPLYEIVGLQLFLGEATSDSAINARGIVVRHDAKGLVIRLIGLEFDSFMLLKKVVAFVAVDRSVPISTFLGGTKTLEFCGPKRGGERRCREDETAAEPLSSAHCTRNGRLPDGEG